MTSEADLGHLHHLLIRGFLERGHAPSVAQISAALERNPEDVKERLRDLAAGHGAVLHPHDGEPWIVHPFSATPTLHFIESEAGSWWAPCLWCALGVSALVPADCRIHTRYGAGDETLVIETRQGVPLNAEGTLVHFAIPPARAWENVHQHCALVLPFRSTREIEQWCRHRGVAPGEAVPLAQVGLLAIAWYGDHASGDWRKWTVAEARALFAGAGLTSDFWALPEGEGRF